MSGTADFAEVERTKSPYGQVVAEIDPQDFKWEYEAKKASFQTAEAQLQRAKKLLSKQAISKQEYETTEASYSNAKAHSNMRRISWNKRNCVLRSMDLSRRNMSRIIRRYRPGKGSFA